MPEEKRNKFECRKCKEVKPISEYVKDRSRKRGHHPYCKECQKVYKNKNKENNKRRALKWARNNKNKRKVICKKWRKKNPELTRIHSSLRRKRVIEQSDGTITKESLRKLPREHCSICNTVLDWENKNKVHLDHIVPLIKGGMHSIFNVQWTCVTCNLKKGSKYEDRPVNAPCKG